MLFHIYPGGYKKGKTYEILTGLTENQVKQFKNALLSLNSLFELKIGCDARKEHNDYYLAYTEKSSVKGGQDSFMFFIKGLCFAYEYNFSLMIES